MDTFGILFAGLPESGKTTYLAALWHLLNSADMPLALRLTKVHGERTYLQKIQSSWTKCKAPERTKVAAEGRIELQLGGTDGAAILLRILDLSGERFMLHWVDRLWAPEYEDIVEVSSGILLFVHPELVEVQGIEEA